MILILIILFALVFILTNKEYKGGDTGRFTPKDITDYLDEYLVMKDARDNLYKYLVAHFGYKTPPEDLEDLLRKIIRDHDVKNITDFIEQSKLTYGAFIDDEGKKEIYSNSVQYEVTTDDFDRIIKDCKSLLNELRLSYKFDSSDVRKILRKNSFSWKHLAKCDGKLCLDKLAIRVLLKNYFKCSCMTEKEQLAELKRLMRDMSPNLAGIHSMNELIRILRELKDYKHLSPRADAASIDDAVRLGLDRAVLESYRQMYPHLTIDQIIREILGARGANEYDIELNDFAKQLLTV